MSLQYIRDHYKVPAKRGGRVRYTGRLRPLMGTITGADGAYLRIRLDGEKQSSRFHPAWEMEFLPLGDACEGGLRELERVEINQEKGTQ